MSTEPVETTRAYYRTIDSDEYEKLTTLLATEFVHERPDRTLAGRERFLEFMRDERPMTDTTHAVDAIYFDGDDDEVAVRGRLLRDADCLFGFVDVFEFEEGNVTRIRTYTQ